MILLFRHRLKIEKLFLTWCGENGVKPTFTSMVAFMQIMGWIDEEQTIEDLGNEDVKLTPIKAEEQIIEDLGKENDE